MLDFITYSLNPDNSVKKTITNVIPDIQTEITSLQSQLAAFQSGSQDADIISAISNYQAQISFLQGLL